MDAVYSTPATLFADDGALDRAALALAIHEAAALDARIVKLQLGGTPTGIATDAADRLVTAAVASRTACRRGKRATDGGRHDRRVRSAVRRAAGAQRNRDDLRHQPFEARGHCRILSRSGREGRDHQARRIFPHGGWRSQGIVPGRCRSRTWSIRWARATASQSAWSARCSKDMRHALARGNRIGALAIQVIGDSEGLPTRVALDALETQDANDKTASAALDLA